MRKGLTEIVFILDRSGSMSGLERDTIGGYNSLMENSSQRYSYNGVDDDFWDYEYAEDYFNEAWDNY